MKTKTRILTIIIIALLAVLTLGVTKVSAETQPYTEPKFNVFSMYNAKDEYIEAVGGAGDAGYQQITYDLANITEGSYFRLNTEMNLGKNVTLNGLGDFTLVRTYKNETDSEDTKTYYEYKSVIDINKLEKKTEELNFKLIDIEDNKFQNFTLKLTLEGEINKTPSLVNIRVVDKDGNRASYMPPQSGGPGCILRTDLNYNNCSYEMRLDNNYGDKIKTDFGTFTFSRKEQSVSNENEYIYYYTCPVNTKSFDTKEGNFELTFNATNTNTNQVEKLKAFFIFYKLGFESNATLKVGEKYVIKDGKVVSDTVLGTDEDIIATYHEHTNTLTLFDYKGNISYSNMGKSFNIDMVGECSYNVTNENTVTGIKADFKDTALPKTAELRITPVKEGKEYSTVKTSLDNKVSKFLVYDISIYNAGVRIQPNGKIKISIPIPESYNKERVTVYRIAENGTKTEYNVKVVGEGINKYAIFETDHFSIYVLAEKAEQKGEKDETPKTGVTDVTKYIMAVAIISAVGIIATRKKQTK